MIFLIFNSKQHERIYRPIADSLTRKGLQNKVLICPEHCSTQLNKILSENHSIVIAGSDAAAHLPGLIAGKTTAPVIGVPCSSMFSGLDALLSIVQMPPGTPVLSVGVENIKQVNEKVPLLKEKYEKVNLLYQKANQNNKRIRSCMETLDYYNIDYVMASAPKKEMVNINFTLLTNGVQNKFLTINVPMSNESTTKDAHVLMRSMSTGFWVGLNRGENAAHAAAQILSLNDPDMKDKILSFRQEQEKPYMN